MGCNHGNLCTLTNRNGELAEKVTEGREKRERERRFQSLHDRGKVFARCQKRSERGEGSYQTWRASLLVFVSFSSTGNGDK